MNQHSIIFWNVQRLFGSRGSPIEQALSGEQANASDIDKKIKIIAATIDQISQKAGTPMLIGLVEIENTELCQKIAESITVAPMVSVDKLWPDETGFALDGLDIGLLINQSLFKKILKLRSHVIDRKFITRDVLECDLELLSGTTLSVLVNHWPSRLISEAALQRISAALYTRSLIATKTRYTIQEMWDQKSQSLLVPNNKNIEQRSLVPVVVMGDFNDEMFDQSIELMGSTSDPDAVSTSVSVKGTTKKERFRSYADSIPFVFNPFWSLIHTGGSYYRSPRWRFYDQIMLSKGFITNSEPLTYVPESTVIFREKAIPLADGSSHQITNKNGKPIAFDAEKNRGCSDHFPVYLSIKL